MPKAIDTLIKYLDPERTPSKNVAIHLDDETLKDIARKVKDGYRIDDDSRSKWLQLNKKAMELVTNEELMNSQQKDFPIPDAAKVIYPLISNSIIQAASMLIMHLVRNGKVAECAVLGEDYQRPIPGTQNSTYNSGNLQQKPQNQSLGMQQPQQVQMEWVKASKAQRIEDFLNYELLIDSDTWLEEEHRLMHIVSAWGVGFKECYYDPATKKNCSELIPPEDVIINDNTYGGLDQARRITIRQYLSKNDVIEGIRAKKFLNLDWNELFSNHMDNEKRENASNEMNPVIEGFRQFCYIDLDNDDYEEPYFVTIAADKETVLCIYPAFEFKNINLDTDTGEILSIRPTINIVDSHFISSPEGKFYSYGLNHLLFHQNKSITTILRQLLDAGKLRNAAGTTGFVSKALKTRERTLRIAMGQFIPVDLPQGTAMESHFMSLPIVEPSQVLLELLNVLIQTSKETGFLTEVLTGQTEMQNVPATSMLASIEQATRAFKPVVQKLFRSKKKEFKIWYKLYQDYLDITKYVKFQGKSFQVTKDDFDDSLDICPVADPTMASEAHKYARIQALSQFMQTVPGATNIQEGALRYYTDLQFPNPQALVAPPPPPPPPDPKLIEAQTKAQLAPGQQHLAAIKENVNIIKATNEHRKTDLKEEQQHFDMALEAKKAHVDMSKTIVDAHKESLDAANAMNHTKIEAYNAETKRHIELQRNAIMDRESRKTPDNKGMSGKNT